MSRQRVTVNGEPRVVEGRSVHDLLVAEGFDPARRGLAVALNGAVVPRKDWSDTRIAPGDDVEIVKPFSGG